MWSFRASLLFLQVAVVTASAAAQQIRIDQVAPRLMAATADSLEWWRQSCELLEAQLNFDVAQATATARDLVTAAEASAVPGAKTLAVALLGLTTTRLEGPVAASPLVALAVEPDESVAAVLRVQWYLARSRWSCFAGHHDQELVYVERARALCVGVDEPALRVRAAMASLFELPINGTADLKRVFDAIEADGRGDEVRYLRPWQRFHEHWVLKDRGRNEEANRILDEIEPLAIANGDRRLFADIQLRRARFHWHANDYSRAATGYETAATAFEALRDRPSHAYVIEVWADAATKLGDFAKSDALIEKNRELIEGRGYPGLDYGILETRFDLAVARKDGAQAAEFSSRLDQMRRNELAVERRTDRVRDSLVNAEAERVAAEAELEETLRRASEFTWWAKTIGSTGAIAGLVVIAVIAVRSRRRLLLMNARLAEQVARAERAQQDREKLEERMRQMERSETLGTMAAGVAHDFNNLLTSILGNAELLASSNSLDEVPVMAEEIAIAGQQAARLCRQLQVYAGGVALQSIQIDLVALMRGMMPVLRSAVHGALDIQIESEGASIGVLGDRAQLEQVLLNLVVNARDANARSVRLRIPSASGGADSDSVPAPDVVRIEVIDDGEGMAPEVTQRVFDPFFTTRFPGRGLGLAVVYGVVRRHGGSIEVRSEPGRGSTFTVVLPRAAAPAASTPPVATTEGLLRPVMERANVFVVDDDAHVREVLERMLQTLGYVPLGFGDGQSVTSAVERASRQVPTVLFVDLEMPRMDGLQVARAVRARRADVRLVLMSGHAHSYVEQVTEQMRPDAVLVKPFQLDQVRSVMVHALGVAQPLPIEHKAS